MHDDFRGFLERPSSASLAIQVPSNKLSEKRSSQEKEDYESLVIKEVSVGVQAEEDIVEHPRERGYSDDTVKEEVHFKNLAEK